MSSLTMPTFAKPMETFEDLLKNSKVSIDDISDDISQ